MNSESLKKVLDILDGLKETMHDEANASVKNELELAISLVRECIESGEVRPDNKEKLLSAIGQILAALPSIVALLKLLSD